VDAPKSSVWIVNAGAHSYHKAEKFGELKVLTEGRVNVFGVDNLRKDLVERLNAEGKKNDFVLISGYSIPNGIVMHWFLKKFGFCKMLVWEANHRRYMALTLSDFEVA
jgi:hypothetical protein